MTKSISLKKGPQKGTKLLQIKRTKIGERIFSARRSCGLSQNDLGKKTGLTLRAISYYERESENIPAPILKKIADALQVTTSYLLHESPQKKIRDNISPKYRRLLEKIQALSPKDQAAVFRMVEGLAAENNIKK